VQWAVSPSGDGSTSPSSTAFYNDTSSQSISASAGSGFVFDQWGASSGSITFGSYPSSSTTATIGAAGTITAYFGVTERINATLKAKGFEQTVYVSGCEASDTSFTGDKTIHSLIVQPSCSLTLYVGHGYLWNQGVSGNSSAVAETSCSSGTCSVTTLIYENGSTWQLGGATHDSDGKSGIEAGQEVEGSLSSPVSSMYWFGPVSGFTDTNGIWHTIRLQDSSDGGGIEMVAEYISSTSLAEVNLNCSGLSAGTTYTDEIYWNASAGGFLYTTTLGGTCGTFTTVESNSPTINSGGSIDMMESSDFTANDFSSLQAYVQFNPSLVYMSSGTWTYTADESSYNNMAVATVGLEFVCNPPLESLFNSGLHLPPYPTGDYSVLGC